MLQTLILRMKLPEMQFETVVSIPTKIIGQIPDEHIAHIFGLYPDVTIIEFFDGKNVRRYTKGGAPQSDKPELIKTAGNA